VRITHEEDNEVVVRVRVDKVHVRADRVDLSAHTWLQALPEAVRGLTAMRELTMANTVLQTLSEWLGELRGLNVLHVGTGIGVGGKCPLRALPASLGALMGRLRSVGSIKL